MAGPNDAQLVLETLSRYGYMRDNGHTHFIEKANRCDDYFAGDQWDPLVKQRLDRQGKPVLTINKTMATIATVMGEQLRNRADISFKPSKGGSQDTATVLNKVYIQVANNNKLDWVESSVADNGFITSRGFFDVRVEFDDQLQGEVRVKSLNPRNVLIDPDAEEYDPATWKDVVITKWLSYNDLVLLYGQKYADNIAKGGALSEYEYDFVERHHQTFGGFVVAPSSAIYADYTGKRMYRVVERQYKKLRYRYHFVDANTGDTRPVPDNWTERKVRTVAKKVGIDLIRKRVEQIRWTVVCRNTLLHDDWSPYQHFTVVPYFPFFRHGRTIGLVENLMSAQDLLNKTTSQELHIVNTTANSGWKVRSGSLQNMTIEELEDRGAETGLVVELDDVASLEKITPNSAPTGHDRLGFKADEFIKEISGISDSQRGMDRADVAAKAIAAKQAAGSINLAKPLDNLARTRHMLAERILNLVQTYYTEQRVIQITGNRLDAKTEEITINERTPEGLITNDLTIGEYEVTVTTAPARNNFQETQFAEAVQLRELGVKIPDSVLIQNSSLENKQEIIDSQQTTPEQQEMEMRQQQMELRKQEVEIAEMETKAILNRANAMLAMKRAAQVEAETPQGGQTYEGVSPIDVERLNMDREDRDRRFAMEQDRLNFEKQHKTRQRADDIRLRLEKMAQEREDRKAQNKANVGGK